MVIFWTSIILVVTEYREIQMILGVCGGMLPRENFTRNTSKIMILNHPPAIQRSYNAAQRRTAALRERGSVRGKQLFSCQVKN